MSTNGGLKSFNKIETLKIFPMTVDFNKFFMETIISFKEVTDIPGVRITTDTNQECAMTVTLKKWKDVKSKECKYGIYFYDTEKKDDESEENNNINISITLLIIIFFRPPRKTQTS